MSLVSYADSDGSSEDDSTESKEVALKSINETKNCVNTQGSNSNIETNEETTKPKSIGNFFSSLPAPWMSGVSWASKDGNGKVLKKQEKKQQTVKISLPVAEESDSDDETSPKEVKKQYSGSQKTSGLFGLLPKPKHSVVVKENNPNRPVTKISNRPLIPDSLRRKQAKKTSAQTSNQDSDDDDDENVAFFSFEEKQPDFVKNENKDQKVNNEYKPTTSHQGDTSFLDNKDISKTEKQSLGYLVSQDATTSNADCTPSGLQSHSFAETMTSTYPNQQSTSFTLENQQGFVNMTESQRNNTQYSSCVEQHPGHTYKMVEVNPEYNFDYSQPSTQHDHYGTYWQPQVQRTFENTSQQQDQLKKLQGKRNRGEENINIIEVNADDQVGPTSDWQKQYKQHDMGYQPQSKKKENLPSSQQRRKHQITYLAFQAKEAEWELRNQWATNSQTRRQTQSKYGF